MAKRRGAWRRVATGAATVLFSTLLTLGAVELAAHAWVPPFTLDQLLRRHATLGVEPIPGATVAFAGLTVAIPETTIHIAASGVREPAPKAAGPNDAVRRVACLGDSVVFGWGVADEQAFCPLLAARLGPPWEPLNLGVPSYNLEQTVARFEALGLSLRPTRAVLLLNANDFDARVDPLDAGWWVRHSALVRWVRARLARKAAAESLTAAGRDEPAGLAALARLRTLTSARAIPLDVVLTFAPNDALKRALRGLRVVQAADVLQNRELVIPRDGHPNAAGHRTLADRLASR